MLADPDSLETSEPNERDLEAQSHKTKELPNKKSYQKFLGTIKTLPSHVRKKLELIGASIAQKAPFLKTPLFRKTARYLGIASAGLLFLYFAYIYVYPVFLVLLELANDTQSDPTFDQTAFALQEAPDQIIPELFPHLPNITKLENTFYEEADDMKSLLAYTIKGSNELVELSGNFRKLLYTLWGACGLGATYAMYKIGKWCGCCKKEPENQEQYRHVQREDT